MKKGTFLTLTAIPTIVLMILTTSSVALADTEETIFEMDDPQGDDYGPGTYVYPTKWKENKPIFAPGSWDLLHFEVSKDGEDAIFRLTVENLVDVWSSNSGVSVQWFLVCIDTDRVTDSGATWTPFNVNVHPDDAWEYMLGISGAWCPGAPHTNTIFLPDGSMMPPENENRTGGGVMYINGDNVTGIVTVKASMDLIGEPTKKWAYTVLLWAESMGSTRSITPTASDWDAGGADNDAYEAIVHPIVFDILVPEDMTQEEVLTSYSVSENKLATIYAVGPVVVPEDVEITLTPSSGLGVVTVSGLGFSVNSEVEIDWAGEDVPTVPTTIKTDDDGNFTAIISVPTTTPGDYTVAAVDESGNEASATFTVEDMTGPQGPAGSEGPQGETGEQGPAGAQGEPASTEVVWAAIAIAIIALLIAIVAAARKSK